MKKSKASLAAFALAWLAAGSWELGAAAAVAQAQQAAVPPLPAILELMREVVDHQKQLEKVRENYTFSAAGTIQEIGSDGQVILN